MLLVEDQPVNQQLAMELLRDMGVSPDLAQHGEEAISLLAAHDPITTHWCSWICKCRCSMAMKPPSIYAQTVVTRSCLLSR